MIALLLRRLTLAIVLGVAGMAVLDRIDPSPLPMLIGERT
jgi:hypothetical protein